MTKLSVPSFVRCREPLAPLTTLELGGKAEYFVDATEETVLLEALRWAKREKLPVHVMGGGSNLVIADQGVEGLVVRIALPGHSMQEKKGALHVTASAGEVWDGLVQEVVMQNCAGIECLSGIPGLVGATPIQNVGAYGQEVSDTIQSVTVLERESLQVRSLSAAECDFSYRGSRFKTHPHEFIVLGVSFVFQYQGKPSLAYKELASAFEDQAPPTLEDVRQKVLELRRSKSMLIDADDPNRRSVGSFFMNPIVPQAVLARMTSSTSEQVPSFALEDELYKIPAAWLIEHTGFHKGQRHGNVGISSKHALALVHDGHGSSAELCNFARSIRAAVQARFGIKLMPEPALWGLQL